MHFTDRSERFLGFLKSGLFFDWRIWSSSSRMAPGKGINNSGAKNSNIAVVLISHTKDQHTKYVINKGLRIEKEVLIVVSVVQLKSYLNKTDLPPRVSVIMSPLF